MKKKPELFEGVKSMRVLSHKYGGMVGGFTAMWGFESLAHVEGWENNFCEIPEEMALRSEFMKLIIPGSFSVDVWESVKTLTRKTKPKRAKK
jgi:hypothetical protein